MSKAAARVKFTVIQRVTNICSYKYVEFEIDTEQDLALQIIVPAIEDDSYYMTSDLYVNNVFIQAFPVEKIDGVHQCLSVPRAFEYYNLGDECVNVTNN